MCDRPLDFTGLDMGRVKSEALKGGKIGFALSSITVTGSLPVPTLARGLQYATVAYTTGNAIDVGHALIFEGKPLNEAIYAPQKKNTGEVLGSATFFAGLGNPYGFGAATNILGNWFSGDYSDEREDFTGSELATRIGVDAGIGGIYGMAFAAIPGHNQFANRGVQTYIGSTLRRAGLAGTINAAQGATDKAANYAFFGEKYSLGDFVQGAAADFAAGVFVSTLWDGLGYLNNPKPYRDYRGWRNLIRHHPGSGKYQRALRNQSKAFAGIVDMWFRNPNIDAMTIMTGTNILVPLSKPLDDFFNYIESK